MCRMSNATKEGSRRRLHEDNAEDSKRLKESMMKEDGELSQPTEAIDETAVLKHILGFDGFGTTKNMHVIDNSTTAAKGGRAPRQARKARQYMNLKKKQPGGKAGGTENGEIAE